jgi:hypothetical protein
MITLDVKCISKSSNLEGNNVVSTVVLSPIEQPIGFSTGTVIGTPNTAISESTAADAAKAVEDIKYTLTGAISITIRDSSEADSYIVGNTYKLSVGAKK